jgi:membrane protein YdbS with pleckstrin-like domain
MPISLSPLQASLAVLAVLVLVWASLGLLAVIALAAVADMALTHLARHQDRQVRVTEDRE